MCSPAPYLPDWVGTTVVFNLGHDGHGQCALFFHHHGFDPALDCYDICQRTSSFSPAASPATKVLANVVLNAFTTFVPSETS